MEANYYIGCKIKEEIRNPAKNCNKNTEEIKISKKQKWKSKRKECENQITKTALVKRSQNTKKGGDK